MSNYSITEFIMEYAVYTQQYNSFYCFRGTWKIIEDGQAFACFWHMPMSNLCDWFSQNHPMLLLTAALCSVSILSNFWIGWSHILTVSLFEWDCFNLVLLSTVLNQSTKSDDPISLLVLYKSGLYNPKFSLSCQIPKNVNTLTFLFI